MPSRCGACTLIGLPGLGHNRRTHAAFIRSAAGEQALEGLPADVADAQRRAARAAVRAPAAPRRCSACSSIGLPGLGHNLRTHHEFITSLDGQEALRALPGGVAAAQVDAAANARAAAERRDAQRTSVPSRGRQTHEVRVPNEIRNRHGDRVRRGFNRNYSRAANAPSWQRLDTAVSAFISRPQLLEVTLGRKVRMVSRAILEQVKRLSPHVDLQLPWHCYHVMFDVGLTAAFMGVLNRNLLTARQMPVSVAEFHRFVGCFLMRCLVAGGAVGVRERCRGRADASAEGLIDDSRYAMLKRHFTLVPNDSPQSDEVRQRVRAALCAHAVGSRACVARSQNVTSYIDKLQNAIADRSMELFYVNGSVISIDDWKWVNNASDLPFKFKVPKGVGWPAENAVTLPHKFVLVSRKRVRDMTTEKLQGCVTTMMECVTRISKAPHSKTSVTTDRGFTTYDLAEKGQY